MMFSDLSKCFPISSKTAKMGTWSAFRRYFLDYSLKRPWRTGIFAAQQVYYSCWQHFCPSRERDLREASRECRKPQHIFSSGDQSARPMNSVRAGAISSCPATAVQERGLTGRLHVHVVDDRDSLRAGLGGRAMDIVEGILERKGATLIRG